MVKEIEIPIKHSSFPCLQNIYQEFQHKLIYRVNFIVLRSPFNLQKMRNKENIILRHAIKIKSLVNSQSNNKLVNFKNQSNNILSIFLLCNVFFDLQNLHSTRIRASIVDIGLYKYSLIKITANFIDHLLSDSRMTPVTIGQINLRKSVLSAPGH